mgnify:CR=1 FL=1
MAGEARSGLLADDLAAAAGLLAAGQPIVRSDGASTWAEVRCSSAVVRVGRTGGSYWASLSAAGVDASLAWVGGFASARGALDALAAEVEEAHAAADALDGAAAGLEAEASLLYSLAEPAGSGAAQAAGDAILALSRVARTMAAALRDARSCLSRLRGATG